MKELSKDSVDSQMTKMPVFAITFAST